MMTQREEELLFMSYKLSAERVLGGLGGTLSIRNSRDGSAPAVPMGLVVGLCGQGGRHIFFDIPIQDVENAMYAIRELPKNVPSLLGRLQAICINLRQATNFYPSSGCVNDRAPRLVPWMPPEEIWTRRGEIPLDLWRILSFDIDVVSTTLNMALESADLSYTSLSQAALSFSSLARRAADRTIEFDLEEGRMPTTLSSGSRRFRCSLIRLLFEAGALLTPLSQDDDFSRWFLAFRYLNWIASNATLLQVKKDFRRQSVDSRYKGIFSEEIAIGMMAVVLQDVYGSIRISNTAEIITKPVGPVADFIAFGSDKAGNPIYLKVECKGSLGNPVSLSRMRRAKEQIEKTKIMGPTASLGLICSSTIYYEDQSKSSRCLVEDPPDSLDASVLELDDTLAWRAAYAKLLRFIGLERASREVASGEPAVSLPLFVDQEHRQDEGGERRSIRRNRLRTLRERFHAESILDLGFGAVVIDSLVHKVLRNGLTREGSDTLAHYLTKAEISRKRFDAGISFVNGLGIGLVIFGEVNIE